MTMLVASAAPSAALPLPRRAIWPVATLGTMLLLIAVLTARLVAVTWPSQSELRAGPSQQAPVTVTRMAASPVLPGSN